MLVEGILVARVMFCVQIDLDLLCGLVRFLSCLNLARVFAFLYLCICKFLSLF